MRCVTSALFAYQAIIVSHMYRTSGSTELCSQTPKNQRTAVDESDTSIQYGAFVPNHTPTLPITFSPIKSNPFAGFLTIEEVNPNDFIDGVQSKPTPFLKNKFGVELVDIDILGDEGTPDTLLEEFSSTYLSNNNKCLG